MTNTEWLILWYTRQCNNVWEHSYGIKIDTIDNPGWELVIDIAETPYQQMEAREQKNNAGDDDWFDCKIAEKQFLGHGDPSKLDMMLGIFRNWIDGAG